MRFHRFAAAVGCLAVLALARAEDPPRQKEITNSLGMRFVRIPAGEFQMGSAETDPAAQPDEQPRHRVQIKEFCLGVCEVTQAEYRRVMGENPSWFSATGPGRRDAAGIDTSRHPVDMVSWVDAQAFCRKLSELPDERRAGRRYRLPTEAEWEYACRAGTSTTFSTGDKLTAKQAQIQPDDPAARRSVGPAPVGSFPANAFGLHDMHGNVWEWCADPYVFDAYRDPAAVDLNGPDPGMGRVVRGGAWNFSADLARSANRDFTRASRRDVANGLRVVLVP